MKKSEVNIYDETYQKMNEISSRISEISNELYHIQRSLETESSKPKNSKVCGVVVAEEVCENIIMIRGQLHGALLTLSHEMTNISNVAELCLDPSNLPWDDNNETSDYVSDYSSLESE